MSAEQDPESAAEAPHGGGGSHRHGRYAVRVKGKRRSSSRRSRTMLWFLAGALLAGAALLLWALNWDPSAPLRLHWRD